MPQHTNVPDSHAYRCTGCKTVKPSAQFSKPQKQRFKKSYMGNSKLGADTSSLQILCKDCGQLAHNDMVRHTYKCDVCKRSMPATARFFGNAFRKAKAQQHICLKCYHTGSLEDAFHSDVDEEDEMILIDDDSGTAAFEGLPEDLEVSEDENEVVIDHDDVDAIEESRREQAEYAELITKRNTVMTPADRERVRAALNRAREELEGDYKQRKPKFVQELEQLRREARERAEKDSKPERGQRRVEAKDGKEKDDSDEEVDWYLETGHTERYGDPTDCVAWRSNTIRQALRAKAPGADGPVGEEGEDGEAEAENNGEANGETIKQFTDRLLDRHLGYDRKPRPDGSVPSAAEIHDQHFGLLVDDEVRKGKLPYRGPKKSTKEREKTWIKAIDPTAAQVRIKADEKGLARARIPHDPPPLDQLPWYVGIDKLTIGDEADAPSLGSSSIIEVDANGAPIGQAQRGSLGVKVEDGEEAWEQVGRKGKGKGKGAAKAKARAR
ncbi:uncharacterized protein PFL1_03090 [Pseudozyma flocculosa PF-1]|uniref:Stc1 domain-containing protein n=2 Tax=Pseudozyma flocculosa TaxID=84751 RepID=A0A5C3F3K7_9BASI|nr:uncharacterized protein PFL1_03090 [Pseudozyma flocculosa PF-1]EPQ29335.1 hypothetical protein PFL1_03090 [Pseudozyma flocculosa PF-1]SPO37851.1 uncharacterized protein PSFLO_03328 [Pseudozyma flocculosa]